MKRIFIDKGQIVANFDDGSGWSVPASEIAIVGEYSTESGPGAEDHFICIVDHSGTCYHVGDDEGAQDLLETLSDILGSKLVPHLRLETEFKSCILFPSSFESQPLFTEPSSQKQSLRGRIASFFRGIEHTLTLSPEALRIVAVRNENK
jgi:hypothetical protein